MYFPWAVLPDHVHDDNSWFKDLIWKINDIFEKIKWKVKDLIPDNSSWEEVCWNA